LAALLDQGAQDRLHHLDFVFDQEVLLLRVLGLGFGLGLVWDV
jgi:hypothetical protein